MTIHNLVATRKTTSGSTTLHSNPCKLKEIVVNDPGQKCIVVIKDDTTIKMLFTLQQNTEMSGQLAYSIKTNIPITTSLKVEMYRLDPALFLNFNNTSATSAEDLSGSNFDATLANMEAADRQENPQIGKYLNFSGTDEDGDIGDNLDFDKDEAFSICAWVYLTSDGSLISKYAGGATAGWDIYFSSNKPKFYFRDVDGGLIMVVADDAISTNTWTHLAFTYDGGEAAAGVKIYVNGALVDDTDSYDTLAGVTANAIATHIASRNSTNYFTGKLDEVMVFERELAAAEVEFIYRNGYGYGATDGARLGDITIIYEK